MADSAAVRMARYRRHKAGDHSQCRHSQDGRASLKIAPVPPGSGKDLDSSGALRDLAAQLQAAYTADPSNALLARELRNTLMALMPSREAGVDAEFKQLMDTLSRPMTRSETEDWRDGR